MSRTATTACTCFTILALLSLPALSRAQATQAIGQKGRVASANLDRPTDFLQLGESDRGVQIAQAKIVPKQFMMVTLRRTVTAK